MNCDYKIVYSNRALSVLHNYIIDNNLDGHSIVLPTNICHDVFFLFANIGMNQIFVDIDENTLEVDNKIVSKHTIEYTNLILLWNHPYGINNVPYNFFNQLKRLNKNLTIIDDRCLCNASNHTHKPEDEIIDLILYSTGYAKQIDLNHGGFGICKNNCRKNNAQFDYDSKIYTSIKKKLFIQKPSSKYIETNIKKSWSQIKSIEITPHKYHTAITKENHMWIKHKKNIKELYKNEIKNEFQYKNRFNDWRFNILVKNKKNLLEKIFQEDLFASGHYPSIGSLMSKNIFPNAEYLYNHTINLLLDKYYTPEMAKRTVEIINKYGQAI